MPTVENYEHNEAPARTSPREELATSSPATSAKPITMLYPRDPSLDPQLVWKGKDEQDGDDLAVPAVPIYIQEKISPQAIIEDLLRQVAAASRDQPHLFADFNGSTTSTRRVDFYQHDAELAQPHDPRRFAPGDDQPGREGRAKGKVQTIYIDPPYGIKFGSNWQVSTRKRDVKDGKAEDATRQPEQVKAFRDTWELGSTPTWATCATAWRSPASC